MTSFIGSFILPLTTLTRDHPDPFSRQTRSQQRADLPFSSFVDQIATGGVAGGDLALGRPHRCLIVLSLFQPALSLD